MVVKDNRAIAGVEVLTAPRSGSPTGDGRSSKRKGSKSRLASTPRTQQGRELQAERRARQRELLQTMKAKRQVRDDAVFEAQRAKDDRLARIAKNALAGGGIDLPPRDVDDGDDDGSDAESSASSDAELAAKYLNPGGATAAAPVKEKSEQRRRQPAAAAAGVLLATSSHEENQTAASDVVRSAKESHAARLILKQEHGGGSFVVARGHLLGAGVDTIMAELQAAEALAMIDEDELLKLAGTCARIGVPRGEAVVAQGDVAEGDEASMFVVVEGLLTAWIETVKGGIETDVGTLRAGDVFGEQSLLLGKPRGATIMTGTDCILLQITKVEIGPLLRLTPALTVTLAQLLAVRSVQNDRTAQQQQLANGIETVGTSATDNAHMGQLGSRLVEQICRGYGIALARVRMEGLDFSDDEDDDPAVTPTKRLGGAGGAGRAARHAARLEKEMAQVQDAREQYMAALAAADTKNLETGFAEPGIAEQERRRENLQRYETKLESISNAKRAAVYELHRQLTAAAMTTQTGSAEKWVDAQARVDPRIQSHSIDEV